MDRIHTDELRALLLDDDVVVDSKGVNADVNNVLALNAATNNAEVKANFMIIYYLGWYI